MINAQQLKVAGDILKKQLPGLGFAMVVFDFGDGLREFRYISNAQREDMINAFEGILLKWKNEKSINN